VSCAPATPSGRRDLLFSLQRHGYLEETYFDISYDPVRDESGRWPASTASSRRRRVASSARARLRTLTGMGRISLNARTLAGTLERAADVLGENPEDVAFTLLYEWDARAATAKLRATAGIDAGHPALTAAWPLVPTLPSEGVVLDAADAGPAGASRRPVAGAEHEGRRGSDRHAVATAPMHSSWPARARAMPSIRRTETSCGLPPRASPARSRAPRRWWPSVGASKRSPSWIA
jgi:hypothetical protein